MTTPATSSRVRPGALAHRGGAPSTAPPDTHVGSAGATSAATSEPALALTATGRYLVEGLRLSLGAVFLWAFLDKLLGLGFATPASRAWIAGGSPTLGFLKFGTHGPLAGLYQALAGNPWVDALFMAGLLLVGAALILGIGLRVAAAAGALMLLLMWSAMLPPANNPVVDDHVVQALVLLALPHLRAGHVLGIASWWTAQPVVQRHPILT